jgi:DNA-directed RNA polymerase subunit N (RpoN/RPB10)
LADKWDYYERECKKLEATPITQDEKVSKNELKNMDKRTRGQILDDLGLKRICCRRHMIGHVDMMDLI